MSMINHPFKFWHKSFDRLGCLSWEALLGRFVLVSADVTTTRQILESAYDLPLVLHPNATTLLGSHNIAFLTGDVHRELRREVLPLFTSKSLAVYLSLQQQQIRSHF